jgi:hypothetical protein
MADIARKDRHPVLVGDVVVSVAGDVVPLEPGAPDPASAPRLTLADVGETSPRRDPDPRSLRRGQVRRRFVHNVPAGSGGAGASRRARDGEEVLPLGAHGDAPMLALIGSTGTGKSHLLYSAAKALHALGTASSVGRGIYSPTICATAARACSIPNRLEPEQLREAVMKEPIIMIDEVRPDCRDRVRRHRARKARLPRMGQRPRDAGHHER